MQTKGLVHLYTRTSSTREQNERFTCLSVLLAASKRIAAQELNLDSNFE